MNCYQCKHRESIPGNCHIKCRHPCTEKAHKDPLLGLLGMIGGTPEIAFFSTLILGQAVDLRVNQHGVKKGWCCWPFNFDPVWIERCKGFEE